jgi:hypothetical protein
MLTHDPLDPLAADGLALVPQFGVDARRSVSFPVLCMNPPDVDQQRAIGNLAQAPPAVIATRSSPTATRSAPCT